MAVEHRVTIRLSPVLYDHLLSRSLDGQTVAAIVRQAIATYLGEEPQDRQPPAAEVATMAAELAAIVARLAAVEQRLEALDTPPAQVRQRQPPRQPDRLPPAATPAFDPTRHRLGRLCPRGHDYQGTGQSLRKTSSSGGCLACEREQTRERRAAHRQRQGG